MIERILDKYYAKKVGTELLDYFNARYNLDFKLEKINGHYNFLVKKRKYKDKEYKSIYAIIFSRSIFYAVDINKTIKEVEYNLKEYLKWAGDKENE